MLERYTKEARNVVPLACREAASRGAAVVGPEHLVLALTFTSSGPILASAGVTRDDVRAALEDEEEEALARMGISLAAVREHIEATFGADAWHEPAPPRRKLDFCEATQEVLDLARREASTLGHRRIRPEHVVLALTAPGGRATARLVALGVSPLELRDRVFQSLAARGRC